MSDLRTYAKQVSVSRATDDTWVALRSTRDGAPIVLPWIQALVFEGKVFGVQLGSITTPIAGHASIDADQPEGAVRVPDGTVGIPIYIAVTGEGGTTLAVNGLMCAVSNIDVGNGTSTAETPLNLLFGSNAASVASTARSAYTGNGTDPLTAGNFQELQRAVWEADTGVVAQGVGASARIEFSAQMAVAPIVADAGSILVYAEPAAANIFGTVIWAELTEAAI